ncbi:Aste57867_777 [Aphanomyces stellatus]|uniref:Aste57867_777 protein n=1 Tax=Aphanomyces stellatus TaxID=120398 RepID=A0A485K8I0_9STRA|nr:hypothetical protein As57867_000776 [Aphanomyces stellatus]VFT78001.1 Aste57867_777 [Aphanomyces stellatus]
MEDEKRAHEAQRQRRYRAAKKSEVKQLETEIRYLEVKLAAQLQLSRGPTNRKAMSGETTNPFAMATLVLDKNNKTLRSQVERHTILVQLLSKWVASQESPPQELTRHPSWLETTLLAHPDARREGYKWLSEKVYHTASAAFTRPTSASALKGTSINDAFHFRLHTAVDDPTAIVATEIQIQSIFLGDLHTVAHTLYQMSDKMIVSNLSVNACEVVERVDAQLAYYYAFDPLCGTHTRRILRIIEEDDRIVIAFPAIAHDELYPMAPGERRSHGFACTIFDRVTDSITMGRHIYLRCIPFTSQGPVSLEDLGRMCLPMNEAVSHRAAYVEQIRTAVETNYIQGFQTFLHSMRERIAAHHAPTHPRA